MSITLKAARVNAGMSQKEAAKELGIYPDTLSRYETGKAYPKVTLVFNMAKLYGVSYDEFNFLPTITE